MKIEVIENNFLANVFEENDQPHYTQFSAGNRMIAKLLYSVVVTDGDDFDPTCPVKVISVQVPKNLAFYKVRLLNNYIVKELRKNYPYVSRMPIVFLKYHGKEEWTVEAEVPSGTLFE
jgi:hypothetical protein